MNNSAEICRMDALEHITQWQSMLSAIPQFDKALAMVGLLAFSLVFVIFRFLDPERHTLHYFFSRRYQRKHPDSPLFNYLRVAFSDGILHPKIYA